MITFQKFQPSCRDALVVTDEHIARLYDIVGDNVFLLPRGERAKSFAFVEALCRWFIAKRLDPSGKVVAVGGGSVGDTVGFACSVYKRGVSLLQVPTTLVAMVDSSIGGKTAIDLDNVKNAVGSYFFSYDVVIDMGFLRTLDDIQMASGRGEILKYRMLDEEINRLVSTGADLDTIIARCAHYKQSVCDEDPFCKGKRNALNFGHTVGHAMELSLGIPHGVAVANGIRYETALAAKLGLCTGRYAEFWQGETNGFDIYPLTEQMLELTVQDKKNADGAVGFVLPTSFEKVLLPLDKLKKLLL